MRLLILGVLLAFSYASPIQTVSESTWEMYKLAYEKSYAHPSEETLRMKIFFENLNTINKHNALYTKGEKSFEMGINQFSDKLSSEMHEYKGYGVKGQEPPQRQPSRPSPTPLISVPDSMDWRSYNIVTPIKNQGQCGSCWSFSSTGALEGALARATGELPSLSEQNLMDCTYYNKYNNGGCNGGWFENAWRYVADNNGIDSEASYPYQTEVGTCRYNPANKAGHDASYVDLPQGDEGALLQAAGSIGPVSVAINAQEQSFMNYRGGVYYEPACGNTPQDLDHAVLVIGYGHDEASGMDYWLVKNSWGTSWGENGFIKMARNKDNNCAIATHPAYPTL